MSFWQIYWPVFTALVSAFTVMEIYNLILGYYLHQKQERLRKEWEAKVARGEIDPMSMVLNGFATPGTDFALPTTTGEQPQVPRINHGQYL